jgi:hypothetical protein
MNRASFYHIDFLVFFAFVGSECKKKRQSVPVCFSCGHGFAAYLGVCLRNEKAPGDRGFLK